VLPGMLARGAGHVVTISSVLGRFGARTRSSYAASKHALHGYFDSLRAEVARQGIRVTLVCPGFVRTEVSQHALTADGTPHGQLDPGQARGMEPAACARAILRAVARGKREVAIGGREIGGVWLQRFAPGLLAWILARVRME